MSWKLVELCCVILVPILLAWLAQPASAADRLQQFQASAGQFNTVVRLPKFETTPSEVWETVRQTIHNGNLAPDGVAGLDPRKVTFENTVRTLDDAGYDIALTANRLAFIKET